MPQIQLADIVRLTSEYTFIIIINYDTKEQLRNREYLPPVL